MKFDEIHRGIKQETRKISWNGKEAIHMHIWRDEELKRRWGERYEIFHDGVSVSKVKFPSISNTEIREVLRLIYNELREEDRERLAPVYKLIIHIRDIAESYPDATLEEVSQISLFASVGYDMPEICMRYHECDEWVQCCHRHSCTGDEIEAERVTDHFNGLFKDDPVYLNDNEIKGVLMKMLS